MRLDYFYYSLEWRARRESARAHFEDRVFTVREASELWGVCYNHANTALAVYSARGDIKKVVDAARDGKSYFAYTVDGEVVEKRLANYYSFDFSKTLDDVLELFDPIKKDARTLSPQLFGRVRARYDLLHEARLAETRRLYGEISYYEDR